MTSFIERLNKFYPEKRRYALEKFPEHLVNTAQTARLQKLLTDFDFIQAKLAEFGVQALIEDYDLAMSSDVLLNPEQTETLQLIAGALRLSAHVLESDTTQLAGQFWGRLLSFENPEIVALLEQAKQGQKQPWFRPLTANLTPPGGPLIRTLSGHSGGVTAVAIAPDTTQLAGQFWGRLLSFENPEIVALLEQAKQGQKQPWFRPLTANLTPPGGPLIRTLSGHSGGVTAVAIAPDGKRAVSAS
ncbi:hypothetical protein B9R42_26140, partial [Arthrospira platensis PCC 7345]